MCETLPGNLQGSGYVLRQGSVCRNSITNFFKIIVGPPVGYRLLDLIREHRDNKAVRQPPTNSDNKTTVRRPFRYEFDPASNTHRHTLRPPVIESRPFDPRSAPIYFHDPNLDFPGNFVCPVAPRFRWMPPPKA
jgi:hypothetical protein